MIHYNHYLNGCALETQTRVSWLETPIGDPTPKALIDFRTNTFLPIAAGFYG